MRSNQGRELGAGPNVAAGLRCCNPQEPKAPLLNETAFIFLKLGEDSATVSSGRGAENSMLPKIQADLSKATVPSRLALAVHIHIQQCKPRRGRDLLSEAGGPSLYAKPGVRPVYSDSSIAFIAHARLKERGEAMKITCRDLFRGSAAVVLAGAVSLPLARSASARPQEPQPAESVVEAARNAREQASNSTARSKVITNDDVGVESPGSSGSANPPESASENRTEGSTPGCKNPDEDERLKQDLEAAQEELDQIRRELSYDPKVISDGDVDMTNFKSGSSGLAFGSPALSQAQPQAPARVTEVMLEQRISALKEASRIACDSPEDAEIQRKLDAAEQQLKLLESEFALDQAAYYSKPNYAGDTAGKAKLDGEQEQIQSLQSEIERLKDELAASKQSKS